MNLFKAFNSNVSQDMGMEQVARMIGHDVALKENTLLYRALLMQGNEKAAKAVKESMPLLAVSFVMEGGKGKECCRDCLYQVLLDFDAKGPEERLPAEELERVKTVMRTSYHVRLGYESISGLGYHVVVPFVLPEGIVIDMAADARRGEEIFARAYINIAHQYAVWCGHAMDLQCKNVNRMMGLSFDAQVVCRPDARPIRLSREELGIDKDKLAFTVFEGDQDAPRDEEAANLWRAQGVKDDHLFYLPKKHNWWGPAGITGPCGPDTEMFIIRDQPPCGPDCSPACSCGRYLEIWNDVFMQYEKQADGTFVPLKQKNVDTGMGLERTYCVLMGANTVYETEIFAGIIGKIEELSGKKYGESEEVTRAIRIIADHMRTATFIIGDDRGVTPSNVDQGYVLRRLIRRAVRHGMKLGMPAGFTCEIAQVIIDQYKAVYPELERNGAFILEQLKLEEERFQRTLKKGQAEFEKVWGNMARRKDAFTALKANKADPDAVAAALRVLPPSPDNKPIIEQVKDGTISDATLDSLLAGCAKMDGRSAFKLYDTYGFPVEITCEMAAEKGIEVDVEGFNERFKKHQEASHAGAEQRFKGGLQDHSEQTTKLHTATHLLHAALRKVLGPEVAQKGSNITPERLRFDFSFGRKMTDEEKQEVERLVNEYIQAAAPITCEEMTVAEAKAQGAIGLFESKYGERVKVYTMGEFSKEICGGPHAANTGDLKSFRIKKEEASSAGVRRIKATIGE